MKKQNVLAIAVAFVAFAIAGAASAGVQIHVGDLLAFPKNATYDSTEVAIPTHVSGTADVASQDTTAWYQLPPNLVMGTAVASAAGTDLVSLQFDHQSIATADSMRYVVQWTSDEATVAGTRSNFTTGTTSSIAIGTGSHSSIVGILQPDAIAGPFFRVVIWNSKVTNSNVTRKFRVRPIYLVEK